MNFARNITIENVNINLISSKDVSAIIITGESFDNLINNNTINMKGSASLTGITIYNYYESKADLLSDTIESIWHEIFFHPEDEQVFHDVESCISWIYERLEYGNRQFPGFFSLHSFGFMRDEKTSGKKRMMKTWGHILNGLCEVLENDPKVRADVFDQEFTEKKFADILFSLILVSMIRQDYDPSSVLMLVKKTLY